MSKPLNVLYRIYTAQQKPKFERLLGRSVSKAEWRLIVHLWTNRFAHKATLVTDSFIMRVERCKVIELRTLTTENDNEVQS